MSMTFRLSHTVFDGTRSNCISNLLMYPSQYLSDQRTYFVYTDKHGDFSHICFNVETSCVIRFFKTFIGVIHTCFCLFNLIGLGIKTISYLKGANFTYFIAQAAIEPTPGKPIKTQSWPMINIAAMKRPPVKVAPTDEELKVIQFLKLTDLLSIWKQVGYSHTQYAKIKIDLEKWLTSIVPFPSKYNYISQLVAPEAVEKLKQNLLLIINQLSTLDTLTLDQKEQFILRIYDKVFFSTKELKGRIIDRDGQLENRVTCSPTWIEITEQIYKELKRGATTTNRLLQYLQQIKEDIIYEVSERIQKKFPMIDIEWHSLNMVRTLIGKSIGLDRSNLKFDSTFNLPLLERLVFKHPLLYLFYWYCSPQELKGRLVKKITLDHSGKRSSGFDQEFAKFIEPFAKEHARQSKINPDAEDFDVATYIMNVFFDRKKGGKNPAIPKFCINELGAKALLRSIDIPV